MATNSLSIKFKGQNVAVGEPFEVGKKLYKVYLFSERQGGVRKGYTKIEEGKNPFGKDLELPSYMPDMVAGYKFVGDVPPTPVEDSKKANAEPEALAKIAADAVKTK